MDRYQNMLSGVFNILPEREGNSAMTISGNISGIERMLQTNIPGSMRMEGKAGGPAFIDIFRDMINSGSMSIMTPQGAAVKQSSSKNAFVQPKGQKNSNNPANMKSSTSGISKDRSAKPLDKKLLSVCRDMESLFTGIMLKTMRETVHENDFFGKSLAKDIFSDMLYDEYAKLMAKTDQIGLARQIYDQLSE